MDRRQFIEGMTAALATIGFVNAPGAEAHWKFSPKITEGKEPSETDQTIEIITNIFFDSNTNELKAETIQCRVVEIDDSLGKRFSIVRLEDDFPKEVSLIP